MKIIFALFSLMLVMLPVGLQAQPPAGTDKNVRTVFSVPVVVSDREGRRLSGFKKDDFTLYQNGIKQNITSFTAEDEPISVALLIDTSGSTEEILDKIKDAAKDFIELLNPKDQCLIATFDTNINVLTALTSDQQTLKNSLNKIKTAEKEGTVIFSAIDQVAKSSFSKASGRKAIVLLSDGKDFGSAISRKDLLSELEESDLSIYSIFYQTGQGFIKPVIDQSGKVEEAKDVKQPKPKKEKKPKAKKGTYTVFIPLPGDTYTPEEIKLIDKTATTEGIDSLREMSELTAGRFYQSNDEKLSTIFKQVAGELRQQYLLGFSAQGATASTIIVKVNRPDAVVQTRTKTLTNGL